MMLLLLLLQQATSPIIPEYVPATGVAAAVLYFWRQDRADRAKEREAEDMRHGAIASEFRSIVQENTAAITSLREALSRTSQVQCPFIGKPLPGRVPMVQGDT